MTEDEYRKLLREEDLSYDELIEQILKFRRMIARHKRESQELFDSLGELTSEQQEAVADHFAKYPTIDIVLSEG